MVAAVRGLVVSEDSATLRLFAWGNACRHGQANCSGGGGAIVPVDIRRDGFASLCSTSNSLAAPGVATTIPLTFTGSRLVVNAKVDGGGNLRVGLQHAAVAAGNGGLRELAPTECLPITGDTVATKVAWVGQGGDLSAWAGVPIRLIFELTATDLFSFHFE